MLKELNSYQKEGLDTSSLKVFLKNLKTFQKIQQMQETRVSQRTTFREKLDIIKSFFDDKKIFPKINDIIVFANNNLSINFRDQKESRDTTIRRILGRIEETPELKETVKQAVLTLRNQSVHSSSKQTKKEIELVESYSKWAEILRNL